MNFIRLVSNSWQSQIECEALPQERIAPAFVLFVTSVIGSASRPDKKLLPVGTYGTVSIATGTEANAFIGVEAGASWYLGPVDEIRKEFIETRSDKGDYPTVSIGGDIGAGPSAGAAASITVMKNEDGETRVIIGGTIQFGVGEGAGVSGSVSNTFKIEKKNNSSEEGSENN
jgi:hypothetical protein